MSKRYKDNEELMKKMAELTKRQANILAGVYDDLFGPGSSRHSGSPGSEDTAAEARSGGDTADAGVEGVPDASGRRDRTTDDVVKKAMDALNEAKRVFGNTEIDRKLNEAGKKTGTDLDAVSPGEDELPRQTEEDGKNIPEAPTDGREGNHKPDGTESRSDIAKQEQAVQDVCEEKTDPMEDLNSLIGLERIKQDVKELSDFVKIQKMRRDKGIKSVPVSLHLVFTGNPGTGKTTVARILARIYRQIGVLSKGQLVETDRSGLVAGYVGQTALKTQEKIKEALGGILFIDEAYSLARKDDTFGQEAIDTILKAMEDKREDFVVIVAGYTEPMKAFINSNPGLKSRFNKYIEFPDYSLDELEQIFYQNCDKFEYKVDESIRSDIRSMIAARKLARSENFANAREVRNMFEDIITNQARRVAMIEDPSIEDMTTILAADLVDPEKPKTAADGDAREKN